MDHSGQAETTLVRGTILSVARCLASIPPRVGTRMVGGPRDGQECRQECPFLPGTDVLNIQATGSPRLPERGMNLLAAQNIEGWAPIPGISSALHASNPSTLCPSMVIKKPPRGSIRDGLCKFRSGGIRNRARSRRYTSSFLAPIRVRSRSANRLASNGFLNVSLMLERSKLMVPPSSGSNAIKIVSPKSVFFRRF